MEKFNQFKKLKRIIVSCMCALAVVVVVAVVSFISLGKARRRNAEYDEFIAALEKQEADLKTSISDISTDKYLEEQARDYLGMIKDGETLYVFK